MSLTFQLMKPLLDELISQNNLPCSCQEIRPTLLFIKYNNNHDGLPPNTTGGLPFAGGIEKKQNTGDFWLVSPWARRQRSISKAIYNKLKSDNQGFKFAKTDEGFLDDVVDEKDSTRMKVKLTEQNYILYLTYYTSVLASITTE